jgi:hypothetical protein
MPEFGLIASFFREKSKLEDLAHCVPFTERRRKNIYGKPNELYVQKSHELTDQNMHTVSNIPR